MRKLFSAFLLVAFLGLLLNSCSQPEVKNSQSQQTSAVKRDTMPDVGKCLAEGISVASAKKLPGYDNPTYETKLRVIPMGEDSLQIAEFSFVKRVDIKKEPGKYETYYMVCPNLMWVVGMYPDNQQFVLQTTTTKSSQDVIRKTLREHGFELASAEVLEKAPFDIVDAIPDVYSEMRGTFSIYGDHASKQYIQPYRAPEYSNGADGVVFTDNIFLVRKIRT